MAFAESPSTAALGTGTGHGHGLFPTHLGDRKKVGKELLALSCTLILCRELALQLLVRVLIVLCQWQQALPPAPGAMLTSGLTQPNGVQLGNPGVKLPESFPHHC